MARVGKDWILGLYMVMELLRLRCRAGSGRKVARLIMFRGLGGLCRGGSDDLGSYALYVVYYLVVILTV